MKSFFKKTWALAAPYWKSPDKKYAWALLIVIIGLNLGDVYLNVLFNEWNNGFYDSLQNKDKAACMAALFRFSYLAAIYIVMAVYRSYLNQMLQIRWRRWMTMDYLTRWLSNQTYYRLQIAGNPADNPDQRIAEDIDQFIDLALGLTLGLLNSTVTLFSFLFILWNLSGDVTLPLPNGGSLHIPGYMVWVALVYAVGGTWITTMLGRPLVPLNFSQQRFEADFRFSLIRLRENSESVAFYKGEAPEQANFLQRFGRVFENYMAIMRRRKTLAWFTSGYGQIAIVFPYLVVAPRYFSGAIKLGGMMQTASAFGQVQGALSYFVDSYTSIATWRAVIDRLSGFTASMAEVRRLDGQGAEITRGAGLAVHGLDIALPKGEALQTNLSFAVNAGEALLVQGPSGCGKSTLLRTISGLWPFSHGSITLPAGEVLFIPQKPYLPLGSLRESLLYPNHVAVADAELLEALELCGLGSLAPRLEEVAPWSHQLSLGEQQRIAFLRALLSKPGVIFLDEASSALDEAAERYCYELLRKKLPQARILSVGHRSTLQAFHDRTITLKSRGAV